MQHRKRSGPDERFASNGQETDMTTETRTTGAARFILQKRSLLLAGLRLVPVAAMLLGLGSLAPDASATSCYQPASISVNGGTVANQTTVRLSADGGTATSNANGGNNNTATGGAGGANGNGGNAAAGNAGPATAAANGGMIDLDTVNSGGNSGNRIAVSTGSAPCSYGPRTVAITGGTVSNQTTVRLSADGGTATANANGGNNNTATGGAGGATGKGGNAAAGNAGTATATANGGTISVGNINSGGNSGNQIAVQGGQGNVAI